MKHSLVGKKHTFEDGNVIEVIQVKDRDYNEGTESFVTYLIYTGNSLPRKLVMRMDEFISTFGHLFDT
jgi:hypothetical protein